MRSQGTLRIPEDPLTASARKGGCGVSEVDRCERGQPGACSFLPREGGVLVQIGYLAMSRDNEQRASGAVTVPL